MPIYRPAGDNEKGAHRVSTGGFGVFVPTYSKNQEAGVAFAKFLASGDARDPAIGEAVVAAGGQPARLSILDRHKDDKLFFGGLMASMPYGVTNNLMIPEGLHHRHAEWGRGRRCHQRRAEHRASADKYGQGNPKGLGGRGLLRLERFLHGNAQALYRSRQPAYGRRLREGAASAAGRGRGLSRARPRRTRSRSGRRQSLLP